MRFRKRLCLLLAAVTVTACGCGGNDSSSEASDNSEVEVYNSTAESEQEPAATEHFEVVKTFYGESASYGGMTVTVTEVADPEITMASSEKKAVFFQLTIENGTDETVTTNYLNNFALTVDDTFYESDECFTIPVMRELYDFYGVEAMVDELPAGESVTGYLAAEVDPAFEELQLHYIPKTTDYGSRVSVALTRENMTPAQK